MGYHQDVYSGLKTLVESAVSVPVLSAVEDSEAAANRFASYVVILRENLSLERSEVIGGGHQYEHWTWKLYVYGGGGAGTASASGQHVDELLESIRSALTAQRPDRSSGPLQLRGETYEGKHGAGVLYVQTWEHDRWTE